MTKFQINKLDEMLTRGEGVQLSGSVRQDIRRAGCRLKQHTGFSGCTRYWLADDASRQIASEICCRNDAR